MAPILTPDEYRLWVILHQVYDLITRCKENVFAKTEITDQQQQVLWLMELHNDVIGGPITISDLAPILFRSMNSTSSIIDRMKKSGLIEKVRDLPDERAIRLIMTPKAKKILKETSKTSDNLTKKLFSTFSEEEMIILFSLLKKLKTKARQELNLEESQTDPELYNSQNITHFLTKLNQD